MSAARSKKAVLDCDHSCPSCEHLKYLDLVEPDTKDRRVTTAFCLHPNSYAKLVPHKDGSGGFIVDRKDKIRDEYCNHRLVSFDPSEGCDRCNKCNVLLEGGACPE